MTDTPSHPPAGLPGAPTTRAGRPPVRVAADGTSSRRAATEMPIGRPVADTTLSRPQLRKLATLTADREKGAKLKAMAQTHDATTDRHVLDAIEAGIAKASIARALGVHPATIQLYAKRAVEARDAKAGKAAD